MRGLFQALRARLPSSCPYGTGHNLTLFQALRAWLRSVVPPGQKSAKVTKEKRAPEELNLYSGGVKIAG